MYVDKSNDIDNKCHNTYHKTNAVDNTWDARLSDINK